MYVGVGVLQLGEIVHDGVVVVARPKNLFLQNLRTHIGGSSSSSYDLNFPSKKTVVVVKFLHLKVGDDKKKLISHEIDSYLISRVFKVFFWVTSL